MKLLSFSVLILAMTMPAIGITMPTSGTVNLTYPPGYGDHAWGQYNGEDVWAVVLKMTASGITGVQDGPFDTFCLEISEPIDFDTTYDAVVNTYAQNGGVGGGVNGQDPLDDRTAWLYNAYLDGALGIDSNAKAAALQDAIWYIEQEVTAFKYAGTGDTSTAYYVNLAAAAVSGGYTNTNVHVLNLTLDGDNAQDVLVRVPEPATMGLLGLGFLALGKLKRK